MIRRVRRYKIAGKTTVVIKYAADTRYSVESCATHDKQFWEAISAMSLKDVYETALQYDVVAIDEGQFFPDIVEVADDLANRGKIVLVAALDATFQRRGFNDVLELVARAERVTKLSAVCHSCSGEASFSKRLGNEQDVQLVGGIDKYIAVCRSCFFKDDDTAALAAESAANKVVSSSASVKRVTATPAVSEMAEAALAAALKSGGDGERVMRGIRV